MLEMVWRLVFLGQGGKGPLFVMYKYSRYIETVYCGQNIKIREEIDVRRKEVTDT